MCVGASPSKKQTILEMQNVSCNLTNLICWQAIIDFSASLHHITPYNMINTIRMAARRMQLFLPCVPLQSHCEMDSPTGTHWSHVQVLSMSRSAHLTSSGDAASGAWIDFKKLGDCKSHHFIIET